MSRRSGLTPAFSLLLLIPGGCLFGQAASKGFWYVSPAHVSLGTTVEANLVGKQVDDVEQFYVTRPGIKARLIARGKVSFAVAPDAPIGDGDLWALGSGRLGAPARLTVGRVPTHKEAEPNSTPAQAEELVLPVTVSGKIDPGTDSDWYRVRLKAGDGLTIACRSASLGGTVQPALVVLDPLGREVAHDTLTQGEPTVHVTAVDGGTYAIGVQDRSFRATALPEYQLSLTVGPWVLGAYPPTLQRGQSQTVTLYGYGLHSSEPCPGHGALRRQTVDVTAPDVALPADRGWVLSRSLFVDSWEYWPAEAGGSVRWELLDRPLADAANETPSAGPAEARRRELPFDVVHRFTSPREAVHWYRFSAQAGQTYWIEAVSERIDRACDLELIVHSSDGKPLATLGNLTTPKELVTRVPLDSRDPAGVWKAPADGEYLLAVRDLLSLPTTTPAERAYRLSMGPQREEVRVVAQLDENASGGWTVEAGGSLSLALTVVRRGGQDSPIQVEAEGVPAGLSVPAVRIERGASQGVLLIRADKDAPPCLGPIRLMVRAEAKGEPVTTEVRPASGASSGSPATSRFYDRLVIAIVPKPGK